MSEAGAANTLNDVENQDKCGATRNTKDMMRCLSATASECLTMISSEKEQIERRWRILQIMNV
jgi:hypothetical protein